MTCVSSRAIKTTLILDLVCVFALVGICLVIALPRYRAGIDWGDEGFLAYSAVRVLDGQLPHRDFVSLQPPLSFYVAAAAFKLFGTSLATLRGVGLSIYLLIPLLVYGIARCLTKPGLALAAAAPATLLGLPLFNFVPFAVWQGISASLLAVFFYLRAVLRNRGWLAFIAGIFTAASLCLRHDQALYTMVSLGVLTFALYFVGDQSKPDNLRRIFLLWLAGALLSIAPAFIYWWVNGALPEMFKQLIVFPASVYRKTSALEFPKLNRQSSLPDRAATVLFYFPLGVQVIATLWLVQRLIRRQFFRREAVITFALAWSALFYLQAITRSDLSHLFITLPPCFILAAYCWRLLLEGTGPRRTWRIAISAIGAIGMGGFLWLVRPVSLPDISKATETLDLTTGGVRTDNGVRLAEFVRDVQERVPPDRSILALPYQPMFYFLCERRNPTHWNYLWPGDQSEKDHAALIEQAKSDPPAVIFLTSESDMSIYAPNIVEYAHRDYHRVAEFGRLSVYFPNPPAR